MTRFRLLMAAVPVVLALVGCSSNGSSESSPASAGDAVATTEPPAPTTEPTEAPTTTPTVEPTPAPEPTGDSDDEPIETLIADRIRAFFDAREAASAGPEPAPADPVLAEVASGEALASTVAETQRRLDDGLGIRAGEEALADTRVGSVRVDDDTAQAAVCSVDDGVIYEVATGEVVNDDVVTHNYLVDLQRADDVWKVVGVVRLQQWEGVAGCTLAPGDFPL